MPRTSPIRVLSLSLCALSAGCGGAAPQPTSAPVAETGAHAPPPVVDEPSTLDGIYTVAQAARGHAVYENICSECHETEEWTDAAFKARWNEESIYRFWYFIYERMPHGAPPYSLPRENVSDVVTYILQLNGLPAGDAELGTDDDALDDHWLIWGTSGS